MINQVFVVHDAKAETFRNPFIMRSRGEAVRGFIDTINAKEENELSKHPEDFTLFELGEYDDSTGEYKMYEAKKPLGSALEFKNK
jgi:hypothetical protein